MKTPLRGPLVGLLLVSVLAGCSTQIPPPQTRPIILYSGERLRAEPEEMLAVEEWMRPQLFEIETNPDFLIRVIREDVARYPWDTLDLVADTADIRLQDGASDAETPFLIYAHLRLMDSRGELAQWAPETEELDGLAVELALLDRIADIWLLGRTVYDTQPFGPMDELLWARESGYLEDFLVATQGDRFPEARARYVARGPERASEFQAWFERVFEREGPGFLPSSEDVATGDAPDPT